MIEKIILKMVNSFVLSQMCYYTQLSDNLKQEGAEKVASYYSAMHDAYEEMFTTINRWIEE